MKTSRRTLIGRARPDGFSLVELMIALVLGLLVVGGAIGLFLSNRSAYSATESVGRVQENSRVAFELMARDIREAAGNPCSSNLAVANVVTPARWWNTWNNGLLGFENGGLAGSAAGTDSIEVKSGGSSGINVSHNLAGSAFTAVSGGDALKTGDIALACDYRQAAIFQLSATPTATNIPYNVSPVSHNEYVGTSITPTSVSVGNCQLGLGIAPTNCTVSRPYAFQPSTIITKLRAVRWFVAANGRGAGSSLYQAIDGAPAQEIVEGVRNMQLQYLEQGAVTYADAAGTTNWPRVIAVGITLNMEGGEGQERVGTDSQALRRNLFHVVTLRNHNK
jgi:type IV pilus assembly protein PilW